MKASEVIRREYGDSTNFMTPHVVSYGWIIEPQIAFEISSGRGMLDDRTLYGVSVVRIYPDGRTRRCNRLSACFHSPKHLEHIEILRERFGGTGK